MKNEEFEIAEEVAIEEVKSFVEYHLDADVAVEKITAEYPDIIKACRRGLLVFDEKQVPTLTLKEPVRSESGNVDLETIVFRTRIVASEQQKLAKGVDLKNDQMLYIHKCMVFVSQQKSPAYLDKFGKSDYKVIEQIAMLFI